MRRYAQIVFCLLVALPSFAQHKQDKRLEQSYTVLKEILDTPDKGIPRDLLNKATCVVVYPSVKKAALGIGGEYGRGAITCRSGKEFNGPWSAPAMFALEGASIGFQIGGEATDFGQSTSPDRGISVWESGVCVFCWQAVKWPRHCSRTVFDLAGTSKPKPKRGQTH